MKKAFLSLSVLLTVGSVMARTEEPQAPVVVIAPSDSRRICLDQCLDKLLSSKQLLPDIAQALVSPEAELRKCCSDCEIEEDETEKAIQELRQEMNRPKNGRLRASAVQESQEQTAAK